MFLFNANEQLLADWIHIQTQPNGLFPQSKGWSIRFQFKTPKSGGRPYFVFQATDKTETLHLVPISPLSNRAIYDSLKELSQSDIQLIVLCGESFKKTASNELNQRKLQRSVILLSLNETKMETYSGHWNNARLEFRLQKQSLSPWDIPNRTPLNPCLIEDETILARCFLEILSELTRTWLTSPKKILFEDLLADSLVLFSKLDKPSKKDLSAQFSQYLQLLIDGPLKGWITLESYQKKITSIPVLRLNFECEPTTRGAIVKQLRKQSQALHFLRHQALQTSYYDPEIKSL